MDNLRERLQQAAGLIGQAGSVTAFTGAGISTESGISDFRSPGGVWDRYRVVTFQEFLSSRSARIEYWTMKRELFKEMGGASPNKAHLALASLERTGKLNCLITQNIDGLHQDAGNSTDTVIELHGTNRKAKCLDCGKSWPIEDIQTRLESGDLDPRCDKCNGYIKPATISFGQSMPEAEMKRAFECALNCDLFLMIGSSLQVEPAASIPPAAKRAGAEIMFINMTSTPWDHIASVLFNEPAAEVMDALVKILHPDS
jgi:NAD-dependent deacetylase